jgi:hypothetical protein
MVPVAELMDSPGGSPVAAHDEMVAVDDESVAEAARAVMAVPTVELWAPGLVTVTVLVTVHENVALPVKPPESFAVAVTL